MPDKDELNVIYQNRHLGSLNGTFNETGYWSAEYYWSSTPDEDDGYAWGQYFGGVGHDYDDGFQGTFFRSDGFTVRCVRN